MSAQLKPLSQVAPKRRLRIAYVSDVYGNLPLGAAKSSYRFVEALRESHEVTVLTTGEPGEHKEIFPEVYFPFAKRIMKENGFVFGWPNRERIEKILRGCDLVHIQYFFPLGILAQKIAKEMGIPVVGGFHFQIENGLYNVHLNFKWLRNLLYKLFMHFGYTKSDHLICPSAFARAEIERYGFTKPTTVITNGLPERFAPLEVQRRPENEEKFMILMVGRIAKEKRHDVAIEAIRRSKYANEIKLVITGQGPFVEEVKEAIRRLPIPPEFGFVSDDELLRLYNAADLFVHASEVELEGMAVLEAIGCGLPAIIADAEASASKQFALDSRFLFKAGDSEDLRRKIDFLIENPGQIAEAREAYRTKAMGYGFQDAVDRTEELYLEMANGERT